MLPNVNISILLMSSIASATCNGATEVGAVGTGIRSISPVNLWPASLNCPCTICNWACCRSISYGLSCRVQEAEREREGIPDCKRGSMGDETSEASRQ